ncbi:hypothetical protein [Sphingomonas sp. Leaf4]|uniref:hypothetical protein n=1 Tax=Sphingomonas sp. Leaf4 TaxID=2876553 RepID=UPI001E64B454|nr:hypothetical protein [Sphingomonas sp. Leaf4]
MRRWIGWWPAALLLMPAAADAQRPASPQRAVLDVDIDGDGRPDRFDLQFDPMVQQFWVTVTLGTGMTLVPLSGRIDPDRVRLSLTVRAGRGDIRCAEWRPVATGNGLGCGAVVTSHSQPDRLVLVDTGAAKFLLIYGRQLEWGGRPPAANVPVHFQVMPAIEGAVQPIP